MEPTRTERALERLAEAEERRNELLEEERDWRRSAFERDQALAEERWKELQAPPAVEPLSAMHFEVAPNISVADMVSELDRGGGRLTGSGRIAVERARQRLDREAGGEGYDAEHDAGEGDNLALAAAAYAAPGRARRVARAGIPLDWPWDADYWKPTPKDRIRELEKAGALVAAAIDALLAEGKVRDATDPD